VVSTVLIFEPHLDDAVLSVGEWMRRVVVEEGDRLTVATPFAGNGFGFWANSDAVRARWVEHHDAYHALFQPYGVEFVSSELGPFLDDAMRTVELDQGHLEEWCAMVVRNWRPDVILLPSGHGHPDHIALAEAMSMTTDRFDVRFSGRVGFYEELPYRHTFVHVDQALRPLMHNGWGCRESIVGSDELVRFKHQAVMCYSSQVGADILRWCFHEEVIWWRHDEA